MLRLIYVFPTGINRDNFVNKIFESGAYVRRYGDFSAGLDSKDVFGVFQVELNPDYVKNAKTIYKIAELLGGKLL